MEKSQFATIVIRQSGNAFNDETNTESLPLFAYKTTSKSSHLQFCSTDQPDLHLRSLRRHLQKEQLNYLCG